MISPDRAKLAVLVPLHDLRAPLGSSSYRCFGTTCDLRVYDIASGALVGSSPRKAFRGLCWLPDSHRVLFNSLRNEALHELTTLDEGWKQKYPDADKLLSDAPTYAYDIGTGAVEYFGEMTSISLAADAGQLIYRDDTDSVHILNPATGQTNDVQVGHLGHRDCAFSPDGRFAVVHLRLTSPMAYLGYPTIVDLGNPSRRHHIPEGFDYRLDWTSRQP